MVSGKWGGAEAMKDRKKNT